MLKYIQIYTYIQLIARNISTGVEEKATPTSYQVSNIDMYPRYSKIPTHPDIENVEITLHEPELWRQFHAITNEMIVNPDGR